MIVPVHATNSKFYLLYVNDYAKKYVFVVQLYARPKKAVRRIKIKQYARGSNKLTHCYLSHEQDALIVL